MGAGFVGAKYITPVLRGYIPVLKNPISANKNTEEPNLPYFLYLLYALSGRISIIECILFLLPIIELNQPVKNGILHRCFKRAAPQGIYAATKNYKMIRRHDDS
jgi:hypothetical protein